MSKTLPIFEIYAKSAGVNLESIFSIQAFHTLSSRARLDHMGSAASGYFPPNSQSGITSRASFGGFHPIHWGQHHGPARDRWKLSAERCSRNRRLADAYPLMSDIRSQWQAFEKGIEQPPQMPVYMTRSASSNTTNQFGTRNCQSHISLSTNSTPSRLPQDNDFQVTNDPLVINFHLVSMGPGTKHNRG